MQSIIQRPDFTVAGSESILYVDMLVVILNLVGLRGDSGGISECLLHGPRYLVRGNNDSTVLLASARISPSSLPFPPTSIHLYLHSLDIARLACSNCSQQCHAAVQLFM